MLAIDTIHCIPEGMPEIFYELGVGPDWVHMVATAGINDASMMLAGGSGELSGASGISPLEKSGHKRRHGLSGLRGKVLLSLIMGALVLATIWFIPVKVVRIDSVDEDEIAQYFCSDCDECPACHSDPRARGPPAYVARQEPRALTVPIAVPIIIFLLLGLVLGGWRQLVIPHALGLWLGYL
ncbi:hypothetical protein K438DRAFT_1977160 [Mycena galopus ATCC 62051]|nr:hypothetical protein K438DRAFT_1977160 [Mycena galopus ATCC 62051]